MAEDETLAQCQECGKPLRRDNRIGYCRAHRHHSPAWKIKNHKYLEGHREENKERCLRYREDHLEEIQEHDRQRSEVKRRAAGQVPRVMRTERVKKDRPKNTTGKRRPPVSDYPVKSPEYQRDVNLRLNYGISLSRYYTMVALQCGTCALCGLVPSADPDAKPYMGILYVDHEHATGRVRQLLCFWCNDGFGKFKENPVVLMRAAAYANEGGVMQGEHV
jgi:hypothetical protein